jgi:hypothetical protein
MNSITKYLAGVLTVIALGISVIAYNLVFPRTQPLAAYDVDGWTNTAAGPVTVVRADGRPLYAMPASSASVAPARPREVGPRYVERDDEGVSPRAYRLAEEPMVVRSARPVRTVEVESAPHRVVTRTVEREPRRDWKRIAMVVGGSTAAGAGVGGIFGGKKGALIGAAIAGGVSTIHQTR